MMDVDNDNGVQVVQNKLKVKNQSSNNNEVNLNERFVSKEELDKLLNTLII